MFFVMEFKQFTAEDGFKVWIPILKFGQSDFRALARKSYKDLSG